MRADWQLPRQRFATCRLVDPTDDGVQHIAQNMRAADRAEVHATTGSHDAHFALRYSLLVSDHSLMAVSPEGEPLALLGVYTSSVLYNTGCPWMLATELAGVHSRVLVRGGRTYTAAMLEQYQRLENWVDARNVKAVAWLQRVGYQLAPAAPHGALRLPFHRFSIER